MAYSSAPEKQTYSATRFPGCVGIELRDTSSFMSTTTGLTNSPDPGMVNLLPRKISYNGDQILISVSRPGLSGNRIVGASTHANADARGTYVWEKTSALSYYFAVCGNKIYTSTNGSVWTAVVTWTNTYTTPCGFTEYIDSTNVKKLIIVDGSEGYVFTSDAAFTKITDVDFPSPHLPFPVFLDGYLFLAKTDTGDIYNSNLNAPENWTAGDFISSEMYPDDLQALVKVNNYILAIGTQGCEYFYDAANAISSPLARIEGASLPFGTYFPYSITSNKNTVVFLANNNDGEPVLKLIEDMKYKDIGGASLTPIINRMVSTSRTSYSYIWGNFIRAGGSLLYTLALSVNRGLANDYTARLPFLVFDISLNIWTEFRIRDGIGGGGWRFPITRTAFSGKNIQATYVQGWDPINAAPFFGLLSYSGSSLDGMTDTYWGAVPIQQEIRLAAQDSGTMNVKTMSRLTVMALLSVSSSTAAMTGTLEMVDNDYGYLSPAVISQTVTLQPANMITSGIEPFPSITQLGQYRRRYMRFKFEGDAGLQIFGFEADINKGQQ